MIIQSPESVMPEPYKTYVQQRSEAIAEVLQQVVGSANVQLCPRAITPDEQVFSYGEGHTYGVVVDDLRDSHKSVLYSGEFGGSGVTTSDEQTALVYAEEQFKRGNRIRVKDPQESDGQGQLTVESNDELLPAFARIVEKDHGCVLMPHLDKITHRVSIGQISLGEHGSFNYLGQEESLRLDGSEVYGGTLLGLYHQDNGVAEKRVAQDLGVPPKLVEIGKAALKMYEKLAIHLGRVSVDVIEGATDSGEILRDVVDITPRVGGTTPAEVLALKEAYGSNQAVVFASSKLTYNPASIPTEGVNFIETDSLIINAKVHEVIR